MRIGLIYLFLSNLGSEHSTYLETHDPFTEDGESKFTVCSAMHHFQNTVKTPSSKASTDRAISVALVAAIIPAHHSTVHKLN